MDRFHSAVDRVHMFMSESECNGTKACFAYLSMLTCRWMSSKVNVVNMFHLYSKDGFQTEVIISCTTRTNEPLWGIVETLSLKDKDTEFAWALGVLESAWKCFQGFYSSVFGQNWTIKERKNTRAIRLDFITFFPHNKLQVTDWLIGWGRTKHQNADPLI